MIRFCAIGVFVLLMVGCAGESVVSGLDVTVVDVALDVDPPGVCDGKPDGDLCDDGDPCTLDDVCASGLCVGSLNEPCESDNPCEVGTCVSGQGCVYAPAEDGTTCSFACFNSAQCMAGKCQVDPDSKVVCPAPGEDKPCVTEIQCDPSNGTCSLEILAPADTECDVDSDLCTLEACTKGGQCVSKEQVNDCGAEYTKEPCTMWVCNKKTGMCKASGFAGEVSCDDGNACTESDVCLQDEFGFASCAGSIIPIDDNNPCTDDSCVDGLISHESIDGKACDTGNPCTPVGLCTEGDCVTDEVCECVFDSDCPQPENKCLGQAYCDPSGVKPVCAIKPGSVVNCESIDSQCMTNACVPQSGQCVVQPLPDDIPCSDSNACTLADVCQSGVCVAGSDFTCDDGAFCNGVETCDPVQGCQFGVAPSVSDGISCTVAVCDEATDSVVNMAIDALCDNGKACDGEESCDAILGCQPGALVALDDGIDCTIDSCDDMTGAVTHVASDAACDNGLYCDGQESCDAQQGCLAGVAPSEDDGVSCTETVCDEGMNQMVHEPNNASCAVDALCTIGMCDSVTGCETELLDNCCGNGVPEAGEGCDDGNDVLGDGCDAACLIEPPKTVTVDTFNFNGLSQYPLHLDMCSPGQGACCAGTTTKNQMDAFCTLAGYPKGNAVSWVVEWLVTPACYCWGKCTGFAWLSFCCSDVDDRNVVTSVECEE